MFLNQALYIKNPFWMYLLGSFVVIIFTVIGQFPIMFFMTGESLATASGDPMVALRNLDKNLQLLLLLIPFVVGFLGLILEFWIIFEQRFGIERKTVENQQEFRIHFYPFTDNQPKIREQLTALLQKCLI